MQAIEFESNLHNGLLSVPQQFQHWQNRRVKVILLADDNAAPPNADVLFNLLADLSDDFMADGREQLPLQIRDDD